MIVTDLNNAATHLCHIVDVCSKVLKVFHDYCLFNMSNQTAAGIGFSCFWLKNYKNIVLRYSVTIKQYFCVEESLKCWKICLNAQRWSLHDCKIPQKYLWKLTVILYFQAFFGFVYTNHGVWVQASKQNDCNRSLVWKSKNMKPNQLIFSYFGSNMFKTK